MNTIRILFAFLLLVVTTNTNWGQETESSWVDRETQWNGYRQLHFQVAERAAYIVQPDQVAEGHPWVWRARFPGYHAEMDVILLSKGFHIGYVDVGGMFGSPRAVEIGNQFYRFMTQERGLAQQVCLEGVSRGGLFVYNWAVENADLVACIYCDTPVCDFKSWPGGRGSGLGSTAAWKQCLDAYGFSEEQGLVYDKNPVDHAGVLAEARIPILHIVSENDRVVPPRENTYLLKSRLVEHGHRLEVVSVAEGTQKSNGHHFTHPQPDRVVEFIRRAFAASKPVSAK